MLKFRFIFYLISFFLFITNVHLFAQKSEEAHTSVPWDTVIAEIQTIKAAGLPDSTEKLLLLKIFNKYNLTIQNYIKFYNHFFQKSIDEQIHFLNKVDKIITDQMRKERQTVSFKKVRPPSPKTPH